MDLVADAVDDFPVQEAKEPSPSALSLARSGEGMIQILRNLRCSTGKRFKTGAGVFVSAIAGWGKIRDLRALCRDIKERGKGLIINDLADPCQIGRRELLMAVFRLSSPVDWRNDADENGAFPRFAVGGTSDRPQGAHRFDRSNQCRLIETILSPC